MNISLSFNHTGNNSYWIGNMNLQIGKQQLLVSPRQPVATSENSTFILLFPCRGVSKCIGVTKGTDEMATQGGNSSPVQHLLSSQRTKPRGRGESHTQTLNAGGRRRPGNGCDTAAHWWICSWRLLDLHRSWQRGSQHEWWRSHLVCVNHWRRRFERGLSDDKPPEHLWSNNIIHLH